MRLDPERALRLSWEIGKDLGRTALWSNEEATWIGLRKYAAGRTDIRAEVLGGDLYGGTAGVACFLSELYGITKDPFLAKLARAAMLFAFRRSTSLFSKSTYGLYDGVCGIALAGRIVGHSIGDERLILESSHLISQALQGIPNLTASDVISGLSGVLAVVLHLDTEDGVSSDRSAATLIGDKLLSLAIYESGKRSWYAGLDKTSRLTGYAHGSAGIAAVIGKLEETTHFERFQIASLEALAFENSHFAVNFGDWDDLREHSRQSSDGPASRQTAWCHGSAGILLSRLTLSENFKSPEMLRDISYASLTTQRALRSVLSADQSDTSLCHGSFGLLCILTKKAIAFRDNALLNDLDEIADAITAEFDFRKVWPTSVSNYENTPQLMTGCAGIGHALLQTSGLSRQPFLLDVCLRPLGAT